MSLSQRRDLRSAVLALQHQGPLTTPLREEEHSVFTDDDDTVQDDGDIITLDNIKSFVGAMGVCSVSCRVRLTADLQGFMSTAIVGCRSPMWIWTGAVPRDPSVKRNSPPLSDASGTINWNEFFDWMVRHEQYDPGMCSSHPTELC